MNDNDFLLLDDGLDENPSSSTAKLENNSLLLVDAPSLATLRSRHARAFRDSLNQIYESMFASQNTLSFELHGTRKISEYFDVCRQNKSDIVEFALKVKMILSTKFSNNNGGDNNNNNNQNKTVEGKLVERTSHVLQQEKTGNSTVGFVENHMTFKFDCGIDVSHATKIRDVILLASSGFCYFSISNKNKNSNDDNLSTLRLLHHQEGEKNFLNFLLEFCNETASRYFFHHNIAGENHRNEKSGKWKKRETAVESLEFLRKFNFCRREFHFHDEKLLQENQISTSSSSFPVVGGGRHSQKRRQRESATTMMMMSHTSFGNIDDDDDEEEDGSQMDFNEDIIQRRITGDAEESRMRIGRFIVDELFSPKGRLFSELFVVSSCLKRSGFDFFLNTSSEEDFLCSMKPTCELLLKCFGVTKMKNKQNTGGSNNFSRQIVLMDNNNNSSDGDEQVKPSKSSSTVLLSFDVFSSTEIAIIVFVAALFLENKITENHINDNNSGLSCFQRFINFMEILQKIIDNDQKIANQQLDGDKNNASNNSYGKSSKGKGKIKVPNKQRASVFLLSSSSNLTCRGKEKTSLLRLEKVIPAIQLLLRHWKSFFVVRRSGFESLAHEADIYQEIMTANCDNKNSSVDNNDEEEEEEEEMKKSFFRIASVQFTSQQQQQQQKQQNETDVGDDENELPFKILRDYDEEENSNFFGNKKKRGRKPKKNVRHQNCEQDHQLDDDDDGTMTIFKEFDDQSKNMFNFVLALTQDQSRWNCHQSCHPCYQKYFDYFDKSSSSKRNNAIQEMNGNYERLDTSSEASNSTDVHRREAKNQERSQDKFDTLSSSNNTSCKSRSKEQFEKIEDEVEEELYF